VRTPDRVKALFDNRQRTLLSPFFNESLSIAEAASRAISLPDIESALKGRGATVRSLVQTIAENNNN
jgi:hypothetical protein